MEPKGLRPLAVKARTYERIFEAAPAAMVLVDDEGRIVMANAAAERLLGYGREELRGRPVEILVPPRFRGQHTAQRAAFDSNPLARPLGKLRDLLALCKDGTEIPVEIGLSPMVTDEGTLVLAAIVDIADRKREEERTRLAVEAAPTAMLMANDEGRIVLVNSQAEELFGYAREELIGQPVEILVPERLRAAHPSFRADFMAAPRTRPMGVGRDLYCARKDGTELPVEIGLHPLHTAEGTFVLSAVIDITERKRAEAEREALLAREQEAHAEAQQASRAKDDFLSILSHELRTPLHAILGWADLIRSGDLTGDDLGRGLETIERNAHLLTRIVSDILDVSRIIQGKLRLEIAPCDLAAIVDSVLDGLRPAAGAKRLRVRLTREAVPTIQADAGRLQQVAWNLLSNAMKFSPAGGTIDVSVLDAGSHLELLVVDQGSGIRGDFLPHLFERFTQADPSSTRALGGLGLGLAIARHLVELHGGTITAWSEGEGKGATFKVSLPLGAHQPRAKVPADPRYGAAPRGRETPPHLEGLRVLVVDDERDTRELLEWHLSRLGAAVAVADSAAKALERLEDFHPHIVVSDIAMPGEDGYVLMRKLRVRAPDVPALALTAYAGADHARAALAAGYRLHVAKPVEPLRLATLIEDLARPRAGH